MKPQARPLPGCRDGLLRRSDSKRQRLIKAGRRTRTKGGSLGGMRCRIFQAAMGIWVRQVGFWNASPDSCLSRVEAMAGTACALPYFYGSQPLRDRSSLYVARTSTCINNGQYVIYMYSASICIYLSLLCITRCCLRLNRVLPEYFSVFDGSARSFLYEGVSTSVVVRSGQRVARLQADLQPRVPASSCPTVQAFFVPLLQPSTPHHSFSDSLPLAPRGGQAQGSLDRTASPHRPVRWPPVAEA